MYLFLNIYEVNMNATILPSFSIKEFWNPSVLTEIKITPLAIMKKHQIGSCLVSIGPREKVWFNDPPQFWVKESICVNGIQISPLIIKKKHQNGSSLVSVGPREKVWINDPSQSKFHLRPLRKSTKIGLAWCPLVLEKKCELTTPHNFGSRNPSVSTESKFHLRPLWKSTKMGLTWCPLVLEKKCELTIPHNFGSRNPSVSMEIKISPAAIKNMRQNGSSLVSIGPREKIWINNPPQFWVKESICVEGNQNSTFGHYKKA